MTKQQRMLTIGLVFVALIIIALILCLTLKTDDVSNYFVTVYPYSSAPSIDNINYLWLLAAIGNNFLTKNSRFITSIYTFFSATRTPFFFNPITPEMSYETIVQNLPIINELTTDSFFQDNKFLSINKFNKNDWTLHYHQNKQALKAEYLEVNNTGGVISGPVNYSTLSIQHAWYYWTQGSGIFLKPNNRIIGINKYSSIYKAYTKVSNKTDAFIEFANQLTQYLALQNVTISQVLMAMFVSSTTNSIKGYFHLTMDEFNNLLHFLQAQGSIGIQFGTTNEDLILAGLLKVNLDSHIIENVSSENLRYVLYSQIDLFNSIGIVEAPLDFFIRLILLNTNIQVGNTIFGLRQPLSPAISTLIFTVQWNFFSGWATEIVSSNLDKMVANDKLAPTFYYKDGNVFIGLPDFPITDKWTSIVTSVIPATLLTFA
jgi:hypothetical protein